MASNSLMSCGIAFPSLLSSSSSKFATATPVSAFGSNMSFSKVSMTTEWMPGRPRPSYLDGSAPGDFGFDPLWRGIRSLNSSIAHGLCCLCQVFLIPEALGLGNWVKAQEWAALPGGEAAYLGNPVPWGTLPTILVIVFLSIAFVEHQRSMEKDPEKKKYLEGHSTPWDTPRTPKEVC